MTDEELDQLEMLVIELHAHFGGPNFRGIHVQSKQAYMSDLREHAFADVAASIRWWKKKGLKMPTPGQITDRFTYDGGEAHVDLNRSFLWSVDGGYSGNPMAVDADERKRIAVYVAASMLPPHSGDLAEIEKRKLTLAQEELIKALGQSPAEVWTKAVGEWAETAENIQRRRSGVLA
jgi:hypothetical protein